MHGSLQSQVLPSSTEMKLKFVTLDVFTESRFEGNPLALVYVPATNKVSQEQKQAIAREFNLSETVFLHEQDGLTQRKLDIFIPTAEIPFAGLLPPSWTSCHLPPWWASCQQRPA